MTEPRQVSVFEAVSAAMGDVRAVGKDSKNTSQGQGFMFRGIDAVMDAVGPAFRRHGVVVVPRKIKAIEYTTVTVGAKQTVMASVRLQMVYRWFGPLGDHYDTEVPGEAFDSGDKGTAKAMSVAYRTLLIQALTLPTGDRDPESDSYDRFGHDSSAEQAADIGRWTGEVAAAGLDKAKLSALWGRMKAEWDNVPWSPDRLAIIQAAVDRAAQQPEQQPDAVSTDDPEVLEAQWLEDLDQAAAARDLPTLRNMLKQAQTDRRSDRRKIVAATIADLTEGK
jgi:hypothetical protein